MPTIVDVASAHKTLNIPERQALERFEGDVYEEHHRVFLYNVEGPRWLVATPTLDIYVINALEADLTPLTRDSAFPVQGRPIFAFDTLTAEAMTRLRSQARELLGLYGVTAAAAAAATSVDAEWVVADTAADNFGSVADVTLVGGDSIVVRGSSALLQEPNATHWTFLEHINTRDRGEWRNDKLTGAGRDPRLLPMARADGGLAGHAGALPTFRECMALATALTVAFPGFRGPSAARDLLTAIVSSGVEPQIFQMQFEQATGLSPKSAVAHELRLLLYSVWAYVVVDKLDPYQSAVMEHTCRRVLQLHSAVRRNPKAPDFENLHHYLSHLGEPGTTTSLSSFDVHVADQMKSEAAVMKQTRLATEEREAANKKKKSAKGGGKGEDGQ